MKFLILAIFLVFAADSFSGAKMPIPLRGNLRLIMYKVYHGDMMLLTLPSGKHMVIDAGYAKKPRKFLFPTLEKEGIKKIDYLVLTHGDVDHIGGAAEIIKNYDIGEIWHNGRPKYSKPFYAYREEARKKGIPLRRISAGELLNQPNTILMGDAHERVKIEILNPSDKSLWNNESMVFRLTWKKFSMLLTSDLQRAGQRLVLEAYRPFLKARAYKVLHHGGGMVKGFIDAVQPEVSLCPCFNIPPFLPFIYPSPFTVFKLKRISEYYTVRRKGNLQLMTDGYLIDVSKYRVKK